MIPITPTWKLQEQKKRDALVGLLLSVVVVVVVVRVHGSP
jgi:hypothetical protein